MNGIKLLVPEAAARILYGLVLIVNVFVFVKIVLPKYKFLLPFTLQSVEPTYSFAVVCIIATIAAFQEGYDTIKTNNE